MPSLNDASFVEIGAGSTPAGRRRLAYDIVGRGPWLILVHPLGTSRGLWDRTAAAMSASFRVLTYDLRGHGSSSVPPPPYSLDDFARDHLELMEALHIPRAHLCGLALGGEIAQVVAARAPRCVAALILADTACFAHGSRRKTWEDRIGRVRVHGMPAVAKELTSRWFSAPFAAQSPDVVAHYARGIGSMPLDGFVGAAQSVAAFDLRTRLPKIIAPTTVLIGSEDIATPIEAAQQIVSRIDGARLEIIPGAGHFSPVERPDRFATVLAEACNRF